MADAKLSSLTEAATLAEADLLYAVVSNASRKVQVGTLLAMNPAVDRELEAGETVAAGEAVFVEAAGTVALAQADALATLPAVGLVEVGGDLGDTVTVRVCGVFTASPDPTWTPGGLVYVSAATPGALTQTPPATPGEYVQAVGIALGSDELLLQPQLVPAVVPAP